MLQITLGSVFEVNLQLWITLNFLNDLHKFVATLKKLVSYLDIHERLVRAKEEDIRPGELKYLRLVVYILCLISGC